MLLWPKPLDLCIERRLDHAVRRINGDHARLGIGDTASPADALDDSTFHFHGLVRGSRLGSGVIQRVRAARFTVSGFRRITHSSWEGAALYRGGTLPYRSARTALSVGSNALTTLSPSWSGGLA
jgi:hypothetical protein